MRIGELRKTRRRQQTRGKRLTCLRSESGGTAPNRLAPLRAPLRIGYTGIPGIGAVTAARLLNYGPIEQFPPEILKDERDHALLFKRPATLREDAPLFAGVDALRWRGPTATFATWPERLADPRLLDRAHWAADRVE